MKPLNTSRTLLARIRDTTDQDAWTQFYRLYAPLIVGFARQRGCSEAMAHDVLQETMCRLIRFMPKFTYNPAPGRKRQFRSYLLSVVMSRISTIYRSTIPAGGNDETLKCMPDERVAPPGSDLDALWEKYIMFQAIDRVRTRIDASTWRSFEMYVLDKTDAGTVAAKLNITRNLVYQHKNSVTRLLQKEVEKIQSETGDSADSCE